MEALLAPVPEEHLPDALRVCAERGRVSFGSGWVGEEASGSSSFLLFRSLEEPIPGMPVLIYASRSGLNGPLRFHRPDRVTLVGRLAGWREARAGRHPDPGLRPASALRTDTGSAALFREVEGLRPLPASDQFAFHALRRPSASGRTGPKVGDPPRGPMRVVVPDELTRSLTAI